MKKEDFLLILHNQKSGKKIAYKIPGYEECKIALHFLWREYLFIQQKSDAKIKKEKCFCEDEQAQIVFLDGDSQKFFMSYTEGETKENIIVCKCNSSCRTYKTEDPKAFIKDLFVKELSIESKENLFLLDKDNTYLEDNYGKITFKNGGYEEIYEVQIVDTPKILLKNNELKSYVTKNFTYYR